MLPASGIPGVAVDVEMGAVGAIPVNEGITQEPYVPALRHIDPPICRTGSLSVVDSSEPPTEGRPIEYLLVNGVSPCTLGKEHDWVRS